MAYTFNSVAYTSSTGGTLYVITWAPPPASGSSFNNITSPALPINISDLFQEFLNSSSVSPFLYGTVSAGSPQLVVTRMNISGTPISAPLPPVELFHPAVAISFRCLENNTSTGHQRISSVLRRQSPPQQLAPADSRLCWRSSASSPPASIILSRTPIRKRATVRPPASNRS